MKLTKTFAAGVAAFGLMASTAVAADWQPRKPVEFIIMAGTGEAVSYVELERRSNRLAHLFRAQGMRHRDHYAIFMENNRRYIECCSAGARTGLYYTCINSYLTADEVAFIVNDSDSRLLITSAARLEVARAALRQCPQVSLCLVVDGDNLDGLFRAYESAVSAYPATPVNDERLAPGRTPHPCQHRLHGGRSQNYSSRHYAPSHRRSTAKPAI